MKKAFVLAAVFILLTTALYAADAAEDSVIYRNIPVYKVYTHPNAYIVMYHTNGLKVGQVTLPKDWFKPGSNKGTLRIMPKTFTPYMLLQYVDGKFSKVILTMPKNKNDLAWGAMNGTVDVEAGSKGDTLVLE